MPGSASKKRILIVDDDQDFTSVLQIGLEGRGKYQVRVENKATKASQAAKEFMPDLILMDVQMPRMGGKEVAQKIFEEHPELRGKKIIFLTGQITPDEVNYYGSEIKGKLFIPKGITTVELIECIEKSL